MVCSSSSCFSGCVACDGRAEKPGLTCAVGARGHASCRRSLVLLNLWYYPIGVTQLRATGWNPEGAFRESYAEW
eukprot:5094812-Pyramimonas_sp.AAC.3